MKALESNQKQAETEQKLSLLQGRAANIQAESHNPIGWKSQRMNFATDSTVGK